MLWEKAWNETRWRFAIGLVIMLCTALFVVTLYPRVVELMAGAKGELAALGRGPLGDQIRHQAEISSTFRGYVWSQYFAKNLPQQWTLFAALIGTGGIVTQTATGGAIFTLALPVSRERLLWTRALVGFAELAVLAIASSLMTALAATFIGQSFALHEALTYGLTTLIGGLSIYSLAVFLSTVFTDLWRPALMSIGAAVVAGLFDQATFRLDAPTPFHVMSAASYFEGGQLPWLGLLVSAMISTALLYAAAKTLAVRDF